MTIKATKFTPEVLLSAPRRSAGLPNSDGSRIIYSLSTYSFSDHKKTSSIRLLDAETNESILVTDKTGDIHWLDDDHVLLLTVGKDGATDVVIGNPANFTQTSYTAGTIDGSPFDTKIKALNGDTYVIAFGASTSPDGKLYNDQKAKANDKKHTTGQLYDSLFVRHWDHYLTPTRNSIWYGTLSASRSGSFALSDLSNALNETNLVSPIDQATGSADNFDISHRGLAFVAKDPRLNPANNTKQDLYIARASWSGSSFVVGKPHKVILPGFEGATSKPRFSPNGKSLVAFSMRQNGYEADKREILLVPDTSIPQPALLCCNEEQSGTWDRSPWGAVWANDGAKLYVAAEDDGRDALFDVPLNRSLSGPSPQLVIRHGSINDYRVLDNGRLFVSGSNFVDDSLYYILNPKHADRDDATDFYKEISSHSKSGSVFGLSSKQVSKFYYDGAEQEIQAWLFKPSNFDASKKYPLAFLVHGGPQGAWGDSWSTRWNPAVFAEQGYVVVSPNPTGSTGFGQRLTDAIEKQWGGLPYQDLVKGVEHIEENFDFVDMDRAVALGASYGGFMMNWIQGHSLGRKFQALVTHDGVFSMTGQLASEELWFAEREFGGKYWDARDSWLKWDPSRFTANWSTPHLIIHSEKDYRLTMAEGLSAFNVLQERGVKSKFLMFPDENHWVMKPENSLLWHTVVFDWINDAVGLPRYGDTGYPSQLLQEANMDSGRKP